MVLIIAGGIIVFSNNDAVGNITFGLGVVMLPLGAGIGVLRHRLYDIDVLINRTLVYGALTLLLAALYFGGVIGLQQVVRLISGQQAENNPLVIVLTTLVIAALFQPLRSRLQVFIDRRSYRSRYDAARTLDSFAAKLRAEIELGSLGDHLVGVVEQTMHPRHVSLWLRPPERS